MKKPTNGFSKLSLAEFIKQLNFIIDCMDGNATFASLQTPVQALAASAATFPALIQKATNGDRLAILERNAARDQLITDLHNLSADVNALAKGNETILAASGFPYTQPPKPTANLQQPPLTVGLGINPGELECRTTAQPGMKSVNFYSTTDPAALTGGDDIQWAVTPSNTVKAILSNLSSGVRHFLKASLVGVRGQEVFSNTISFIPQ